MTIFNIGDEVEFELGNTAQRNRPRWDTGGKDKGSTGKWTKGKVKNIDNVNKKIVVEYEIDGYIGKGICEWDIYSPKVNEQQLQRLYPGFLRKVIIPKCDCGANAVYGNNNGAHSHWCNFVNNNKKYLTTK